MADISNAAMGRQRSKDPRALTQRTEGKAFFWAARGAGTRWTVEPGSGCHVSGRGEEEAKVSPGKWRLPCAPARVALPGREQPRTIQRDGGVPRSTAGLGTEPHADPTRQSRTPEFAPQNPGSPPPSRRAFGLGAGCRPHGAHAVRVQRAPLPPATPGLGSRCGGGGGAVYSGLLTLQPATQRVPSPRRRVPDPLRPRWVRGAR